MRAIKAHLRKPENRGIKWVFYDYWCMPQGDDRSAAQKEEFKWMLSNVDWIYLGASVLLLVDLSYISRFWTQFEAWLSLQKCEPTGLISADDSKDDSRCTIVPTFNANEKDAERVREMWSNKSPTEAHDLLSLPDVMVTNMKDKVDSSASYWRWTMRCASSLER